MMARAIIIQWGIPLQRGHPSLRATSSARPNVAGPRLSITGTFNVESQPIALLNLVWIDARGLQRRDVQKYVRAAGVVSDETVTAFGIPHFQFSGRHRVLFPLRLQPGVASRHRRACSLQPFGRRRLRQRELYYPATAAEPVAQREAPAAMSHSDNSFMQSHFLTFSPTWAIPLDCSDRRCLRQ